MLARRFLIALTAAALCAGGVALAQTIAPQAVSSASDPDDMPATAAYPARQEARQWLGLNLIGAKVVSASGETVGRVSNLILDENGTVVSAVIEVGGLLGFGAKSVAVTYPSLKIVRNRKGDAIDHVALAATKDDLRQAAGFKSLHQQMAESSTK
jgi:sporulation protein YlmC with PRC-barrel domain